MQGRSMIDVSSLACRSRLPHLLYHHPHPRLHLLRVSVVCPCLERVLARRHRTRNRRRRGRLVLVLGLRVVSLSSHFSIFLACLPVKGG